jgi:GAF domain-containing protein
VDVFRRIARWFVLAVSLLALYPVGRMVVDWMRVSRVLAEPAVHETSRAFDWVLWQERDGEITAEYVFPNGPADRAGLREGDVFYALDGQQYFNAGDLSRVVESLPPGTPRTYEVVRDGVFARANVEIARYPTFLYPLSSALWRFSVWGFTLAAFLHVLGLAVAGPLALRSSRARFPLLLIGVSSLWIFANWFRLLAVETLGPPAHATTYAVVFQGLTVVGLAGWLGFPALLLRKVIGSLSLKRGGSFRGWALALWLPVLVLGGAALGAGFSRAVGPFTLDALAGPILFYAGCYVAAAAALVAAFSFARPDQARQRVGGWGRAGSLLTLAGALATALFVLDVASLSGAAVTDAEAGWFVVSAQLLSIAPVTLVSLTTLKYGKVSLVMSRALTYLTVLGLVFFTFVGGMALLDSFVARLDLPRSIVAGLYVVVLLLVFERLARRLRLYAASFFATERERTRRRLRGFQEEMPRVLDRKTLARRAVETVGQAFEARSAVLFLRASSSDASESRWQSSTFHPEPPYFTERTLRRIWPDLKENARIWAANEAVSERALPDDTEQALRERHTALAVPVRGDDEPMGLLVMGERRGHRRFYNLEDLDLLRTLATQLALAADRLSLVEREKALAKESAEAQLVALRTQIKPHFLFNALNTVAALIETRPDAAEATVEHLSAIFRRVLQTGSQSFVSLREELQLTTHYLRVEQARFGERLQIERDVPEELLDHPVPPFAVQTLAENAVKHGLADQRGGGSVRLAAVPHDDGAITVTVADTGAGIPALFDEGEPTTGAAPFFGIGLRNVAARLRRRYGRDDLLRLTSSPEEGTTARLVLPPGRDEAFAGNGEGRTERNLAKVRRTVG